MTATSADAYEPEGPTPIGAGAPERRAASIRRNREALRRLAARTAMAPGPTVWPIDLAQRRCEQASRAQRRTGNVIIEDVADAPPTRPVLSPREIEVLRSWLLLDSKQAVAQDLSIAMGTVNTHLTRIRAKYADVGRAAPTKASLVARAVQDGYMTLDEL